MSDPDWWKRVQPSEGSDAFSDATDRLFWLVERGTPDPEIRASALLEAISEINSRCRGAHKMLPELVDHSRWKEREKIAEALSDAVTLGTTMQRLLRADKDAMIGLSFTQPAGRPVDWAQRVDKLKLENRSARLVEFLVKRGGQKTWAVKLVEAKRGPTRKRIYEGLGRRESARAIYCDPSEQDILSHIFLED